jgi:amidase
LVRWIDQETGMGQEEAHMLLTMAGKARLGNRVDPKYTIGTGIAKKYIGL